MSLAAEVIEKAKCSKKTVTAAESCTGGMITAALTDIAGSSAAFERGFVTYSNEAKVDMLGVSPSSVDAHGAVSEEVAAEMARGALEKSRAQIAVSVTGIAGPGGSEHKPEGRVCFCICTERSLATQTVEFGALGRAQVRAAARDHALRLLIDHL
ncbi:CinA family protein [uncultured Roseobacter sp.]|uniref:CinA family protein n=1 Tax=uncultured Roseobacter sp. TaxID=114847 RepID=UPI0026154A5B|nr:CinA family protein [uncultured Roseobacter sp.]